MHDAINSISTSFLPKISRHLQVEQEWTWLSISVAPRPSLKFSAFIRWYMMRCTSIKPARWFTCIIVIDESGGNTWSNWVDWSSTPLLEWVNIPGTASKCGAAARWGTTCQELLMRRQRAITFDQWIRHARHPLLQAAGPSPLVRLAKYFYTGQAQVLSAIAEEQSTGK